MIPTLWGRIQTRWVLLVLIGIPWTILVAPILPAGDAGIGDRYRITFTVLGLVGVLGTVLWEPLYHGLQQWRWEKDWPSLFVLGQLVPEAILIRFLYTEPALAAYVIHFVTTWVLIWLFAIGPIRVLHLRWRYRGGEFL
ncbi:MAG: hypothetical protein S0880_00785 [Actinomycetota bacterium]|nr:hypothetical protein [Actinomycetota bacterium]